MSKWSYITGWIKVCPLGRTQEEKEYILKTVLNHLPVVQGSEEDMYVHIIKAGGHNSSSSHDEYGDRTNNLTDTFCSEPRRSRFHGFLRTQDIYYLFIEAHLRSVDFENAHRQFIKWITRLAKRVPVWDINVEICDDFDGKFARIDSPLFHNIFETPSWGNSDEVKFVAPYPRYDENWCEHLMW